MIYLIGTSQDMKHEMKERPLIDMARIKLIRREEDLQGITITADDEIIWGFHAPGGWERADIQRAIDVACQKGQYQEAK